MTISKFVRYGVAILLAITGTAALAEEGAFVCETTNASKIAPPATHCITWTKQARERMRTAPCDPKTMTGDQMRAKCAQMMAQAARNAGSSAS